jgi:hypothetical protein
MAAHVTIGGIEYLVEFDPPGETANILQLPEGTDPNLLKYYGVYEGDANPDRWISYVNLVKLLFAKANVRAGTKVVTVGLNTVVFQVGGVNTPYSVTTYALIPFGASELGLYDFNKTVGGFTFYAMNAGTIDYISILNT